MKDAFCTVFGLATGFIAKIVTNDPAFGIFMAFIGGVAAYAGTTLAKSVHLYFKHLKND